MQPRFPKGSANFTLPLGGSKRVLLVRGSGDATTEGEYWSSKNGKALAQGIDYGQKQSTVGASQYITKNGNSSRIRTWDAAKNEWAYTKTGVLWSTNRQLQVVVKIPTRIVGRNYSTGQQWERAGWLPYEMASLQVEKIFVKESLTPRQRAHKVKDMILSKVAD